MLTQLVLHNFKAFNRRQVIPLAPITLIFGTNSAGKSSILQALLLLKQTLSAPEGGQILLLPKGDLVDLGSFRELTFRHDVRRTVEVSPFYSPRPLIRRLLGLSSEEATQLGLGLNFGFDRRKHLIQLKKIGFYVGASTDRPAFTMVPKDLALPRVRRTALSRRQPLSEPSGVLELGDVNSRHPLWRRLYEETRTHRQKYLADLRRKLRGPRRELLKWYLGGSIPRSKLRQEDAVRRIEEETYRLSRYRTSALIEDLRKIAQERFVLTRHFLPDEIASPSDQASTLPTSPPASANWPAAYGMPRAPVLLDLNRVALMVAGELRRRLETMVYLGPLREYPERYYIFGGNVVREVGKSGRMLPDLLFKRADMVKETNDVLRDFEVGYAIHIDRVRDPRVEDVFALRLVDERTNMTVSVSDVGFGLSQILPVVVQSMLSQQSIILVEQPEIHLHPRLQAHLGSLFERCIKPPRENQFIIETHSEHLILRLQRLIRAGRLRPGDVSVLYVTKDEGGSFCHPLRLDDDGDFIDAWPEGFFEEDYQELFETA